MTPHRNHGTQPCHDVIKPPTLAGMKCPRCNVDLQTQNDRGVEIEACPNCQGMWLTPAELDELECEAFHLEGDKGSLYLSTEETSLKCPVCSEPLKQFDYRFFNVQVDCCPDHGFWLNKGEDDQILAIMSGEQERLGREFDSEAKWASHMNYLRSPTFFNKIKGLFNG
jgi:Zn-finger nucleic acid-binding protein